MYNYNIAKHSDEYSETDVSDIESEMSVLVENSNSQYYFYREFYEPVERYYNTNEQPEDDTDMSQISDNEMPDLISENDENLNQCDDYIDCDNE